MKTKLLLHLIVSGIILESASCDCTWKLVQNNPSSPVSIAGLSTMTASVTEVNRCTVESPMLKLSRNFNFSVGGNSLNIPATMDQNGTLTADVSNIAFSPFQKVYYQWWITLRDSRGGTSGVYVKDSFTVGCTDNGFAQMLIADQTAVLASFPNTLNNIAEVMAAGLMNGHHWASVDQSGAIFQTTAFMNSFMINAASMTFGIPPAFTPSAPQWGNPLLLFYSPADPNANLADNNPDFPYTLIGWAYGDLYSPNSPPTSMSCVPPGAWFIHESGYHMLDGSMRIDPPSNETFAGEFSKNLPLLNQIGLPNVPVGAEGYHPRFWDMHIWRVPPGQVPIVSIKRPRGTGIGSELLGPELTMGLQGFFFPQRFPTTP